MGIYKTDNTVQNQIYTHEAHAYITKYGTVTLETVTSLHFSPPKTEQYLRVQ